MANKWPLKKRVFSEETPKPPGKPAAKPAYVALAVARPEADLLMNAED